MHLLIVLLHLQYVDLVLLTVSMVFQVLRSLLATSYLDLPGLPSPCHTEVGLIYGPVVVVGVVLYLTVELSLSS